MALHTFSEAARYLKDPNYLIVAQKCAGFLLEKMSTERGMLRSWRQASAKYDAYLEDYASLIIALISLYQTDHNNRWFASARKLTDEMLRLFSDASGNFFSTRLDTESLIYRPKDFLDNAIPSGISQAVTALLLMEFFTGNEKYRKIAQISIDYIYGYLDKNVLLFGNWLCAILTSIIPITQVVLVSDGNSKDLEGFLDVVWDRFRPECILVSSTLPAPQDSPELLVNRPIIHNKTTCYVCDHFVCKRPVNSPIELAQMINTGRVKIKDFPYSFQ